MVQQWVAYRVAEGAMLNAPLPSAPPAGKEWRAIELRRARTLEQIDALVEDTATKVVAALGLSADQADFVYLVAAASGRPTVRMVFGSGAGQPSPAAEEAAARRTPGTDKQLAASLAEWSHHAPHAVSAKDVTSLLKDRLAPDKTVEVLTLLLGLSLPIEHAPNPLDLQSVAREHLGRPVEDVPKRRRGGFWRAR